MEFKFQLHLNHNLLLANRNSLTADNTNNFVGIGSTQPDARLDVDGTVVVGIAITLGGASGIVSATSFYGDGSNLDGVASAGRLELHFQKRV